MEPIKSTEGVLFEKKQSPFIEVARSFSLKKNLGNYESADFFCSAKRECLPEEVTETSERLITFCRVQVEADVAEFVEKRNKVETPAASTIPKKPFDWKNTPGGERWLERKGEIDQNFGEENGERGSSFNDERGQSISGQQ